MRKNAHHRKEQRREEAKERQASRNGRTAAQQLKVLDRRGFVAKRERERLNSTTTKTG